MGEVKQAYPLSWPDGWKRISNLSRKNGSFRCDDKSINVEQACKRIKVELDKLGIKPDDTLISTNVPLRIDGLPRGDHRPSDPGVAVYWRKGQNSPMRCMAIDRYTYVADNLAAIAATLEAMRAIERHGGAEILDRAFTGFAALPSSTGKDWWDVLQVRRDATKDVIEANFRRLLRDRHPDAGGSHEAMTELNVARQQALQEVAA